jgi:hypothetical protein
MLQQERAALSLDAEQRALLHCQAATIHEYRHAIGRHGAAFRALRPPTPTPTPNRVATV